MQLSGQIPEKTGAYEAPVNGTNGKHGKEEGVTVTTHATEYYDPKQESTLTRWGLNGESFKRAPGTTGGQTVRGESGMGGETLLDSPMLQQKFKNRHLQMIAVGGSIGTGLFIGSGAAISRGGPAAVLIAWILMGFMLLMTVQNIGEMASMYPVSGGFYTLVTRFVDPSWGFAMGWNYCLQWAAVLPLELVAAGITVRFWDADHSINIAVWITVFFAVIFILTLLPMGYAEEEFWTSVLKLATIAILLVTSLVFVLGGGPSSGRYGEYWGARVYYNPGAFAAGFKGLCSVFVTAAFSYSGTELVGLAATEHPNPRKALPSAVKLTFWRVTFVYVLSLLFAGLLVPYNDQNLLGGSYDANTSPFVLAMKYGGVTGLPDFINAVICISVLSIAMSCVYGGSRTLLALSEQGYAPRFFSYVDKAGRPLFATLFVLMWYPLAYTAVGDGSASVVLDWLIALSGLSAIFTWMSINIAYLRFRKAWHVQGHSTDELPFRSMGGIWGAWASVILLALFLIAQFYIALFPLGGVSSGRERAESFFLAYLALPVVILFYIVGVVWKRTKPLRAHEIDLVTGRKCWLTAEELNQERATIRALPFPKRILYGLFGAFDPRD